MAKPDKDEAAAASKDEQTGDSSLVPDVEEADQAGSSEPACEPDDIDVPDDVTDGHNDGEIDPELAAEADAAVANAQSDSEIVAEAKAETAEWQDKFMRLHAEWDTYRRRTREQREEEKARAAENLVVSLLPVIDDLERTIDYATDNGEAGLLSGVEAVYAKLIDTLRKDGVEIIDPVGQPFDALEDQAVATIEDKSVPDETVAQVYQKGYRLGTKVLRPATVTVTTGGERESKQDGGQDGEQGGAREGEQEVPPS